MELRKYQKEAVEAILKEWAEGRKKTLLILPTGMGKTICFAEIAKIVQEEGKKVLILAHRKELLEQARGKLEKFGVKAGLELGKMTAKNDYVILSSIQTMIRRFKKFHEDHFDVVIVDEAHHIMAYSYQTVLKHFKNADILGVTATPERGDKKNLGRFFDSIAYEYDLAKAMADGWLCPIKILDTNVSIDLHQVHVHAGDFDAEESARAIIPQLKTVAEAMKTFCKDRKHTAVFLPDVKTAEFFTKILKDKKFTACSISCHTSPAERERILQDFKNGKYQVICNAMLLTEGWDFPALDCVINLRPTRSKGLYMQIVGRGSRKCEGKENLLVPSFHWETNFADIIRPWAIVTKDERIMAKMEELLKYRKSMDIEKARKEAEELIREEDRRREEEERRAREELIAERKKQEELRKERERYKKEQEEAMKRAMEEERKKKESTRIFQPQDGRMIDLLAYMVNMKEYIENYRPTKRWEKAPMTYAQYEVLHRNGIPTKRGMSRGLASKLIDTIIERDRRNYSTLRQVSLLRRFGFNAYKWSKKAASNFIDRIAKNNWVVPEYLKKYETIE